MPSGLISRECVLASGGAHHFCARCQTSAIEPIFSVQGRAGLALSCPITARDRVATVRGYVPVPALPMPRFIPRKGAPASRPAWKDRSAKSRWGNRAALCIVADAL